MIHRTYYKLYLVMANKEVDNHTPSYVHKHDRNALKRDNNVMGSPRGGGYHSGGKLMCVSL